MIKKPKTSVLHQVLPQFISHPAATEVTANSQIAKYATKKGYPYFVIDFVIVKQKPII
jgi:hypothetical protein